MMRRPRLVLGTLFLLLLAVIWLGFVSLVHADEEIPPPSEIQIETCQASVTASGTVVSCRVRLQRWRCLDASWNASGSIERGGQIIATASASHTLVPQDEPCPGRSWSCGDFKCYHHEGGHTDEGGCVAYGILPWVGGFPCRCDGSLYRSLTLDAMVQGGDKVTMGVTPVAGLDGDLPANNTFTAIVP